VQQHRKAKPQNNLDPHTSSKQKMFLSKNNAQSQGAEMNLPKLFWVEM